MHIFMIGATGLLGSEAVNVLLKEGHTVSSLVLPDLPSGFVVRDGLTLHFGSYLDQTDEELSLLFAGTDAFVFAAGIDERIEVPAPAYDVFIRFNNTPLERMLRLAKEAGVRRAVVCGSYFSHFNRLWPELSLARNNSYIKSRVEQEDMALSFRSPSFDVVVLEIPYVFGIQSGRKPVWAFLVELIRKMSIATFYAAGGTAAVTARQVGAALAGAAVGTGKTGPVPLGWFNLTWKQMFTQIHRAMGQPHRPFIAVPKVFFRIGAALRMKAQKRRGLEGGLDLVRFTEMMYRDAFIGREEGALSLGVTDDNLEQAITASIKLALDVLDGRVDSVAMKAK